MITPATAVATSADPLQVRLRLEARRRCSVDSIELGLELLAGQPARRGWLRDGVPGGLHGRARLLVPADAPPTFFTATTCLRWYVRATVTPPGGLPLVIDREVNVHSGEDDWVGDAGPLLDSGGDQPLTP